MDWDGKGTKREVDVNDLVRAAREEQRLASLRTEVDELLSRNAAYSAWGQRLEQLTPSQQQKLIDLMQNPASLEGSGRQQPVSNGQRDELEELLSTGDDSVNGKQLSELIQRLNTIEQAATMLVQREQQREAMSQRQTLEQRVEAALTTFDAFKNDPDGRSFAKRFVIGQLREDPQRPLNDLAAEAAAYAERMQRRPGAGSEDPNDLATRLNPGPRSGEKLDKGQLVQQFAALMRSRGRR